MFSLGVVELALLGMWVALLVVCAIREAGDRRVAWMIAIIFIPFLGAAAYFFVRLVPQLAGQQAKPGTSS